MQGVRQIIYMLLNHAFINILNTQLSGIQLCTFSVESASFFVK